MKVSAFVPLLLSTSVFAASARSNALKSRQASMKRGLVDVCVGLDLDVTLLNILPGKKPLVAGHLDLCLCLSVLPEFCLSNPVGKNVANLLGGADHAHDFFSNLISSQPGHQQCHYPEHCEPICDIKKPCHFGCKDGFVPDNKDHPTQCICPAPHSVCNGVCGNFPHGCASPTPTPKIVKLDIVAAPAPTPAVSTGGPKSADDIIALLLKQGLLTNVANIAWIKEGLIAALRVGGINGKPCQDFLNLLLKQGAIVGVPNILGLWERLGLGLSVLKRGGSHSAVDILDLLLKQGLIANIANLVLAKEGLIAFLHIGDLTDKQCDDLLLLLLKQGLIVGVTDLLGLKEKLGLGLSVLKREDNAQVDAILHKIISQGLLLHIEDLALVKVGLLALVHVGQLFGKQCDDFLLVLLGQNLFVGVKDLLALKESLGLGLSVL